MRPRNFRFRAAADPLDTDLPADAPVRRLVRSGQGGLHRGRFRSSPQSPRTPSIGRRSRFSPRVAASRSTCSVNQLRSGSTLSPIPAARSVTSFLEPPGRAAFRLLPPRPHTFRCGYHGGRNAPRLRRAPPGVTRARTRCLSPISATDLVVKRAPLGPTDPRATSSHSPVRRGLRSPRDPHVFVRAVKCSISRPLRGSRLELNDEERSNCRRRRRLTTTLRWRLFRPRVAGRLASSPRATAGSDVPTRN